MILNVKNLTHGFGDRAIFDNVSFRLLKGEHIGLIGANGEGKSTFMNIITGKLTPDEGTVEWAKNVRVGYLDQHSVLEKGMTIGDVLRSAFQFLFAMEAEMIRMYEQMGDATPEEMERLLAETGTYQELLEQHDFYMIDTKVDELARALGREELGHDRDVTDLDGGERARVLLARLLKTGSGISARVAAPSVHFVTAHAALVSCWPLPQRLLPAFPLLSLCDIFPRPGEVFGRRPQSSPLQYQRKYYFIISKSEKPAGFSDLLFHGKGRVGKLHLININQPAPQTAPSRRGPLAKPKIAPLRQRGGGRFKSS